MRDGCREKNLVIGNIDLVKQLNGATVYRLIDQLGPISRIQISELSQLAPASVTKITRQLLDKGLIKEVEHQASTGGRRAISIRSDYRFFHAVAIRLGRYDATFGLYDLGGKLLLEHRYPLLERTEAELEIALLNTINHFITTHQAQIQTLIAISVVLPGLIDPEFGIVQYMPHISVNHWLLSETIEKHFKIKSFVGHDIRALALAEHYFGSTKECDDSILIRVHRGTGAGILVGGRMFINNKRHLGEIGHIQIDPLGDRCHCGHFGCLETIVSNTAIEQRVKNLLNQGYSSQLTLDEHNINAICKACNDGDLLATEVITEAGRKLGQAISIATNLFNPQKIVIAGNIVAAEKTLLPAIQKCLNNQVIKEFTQDLPVVVSTLDHQSAIGAFALVKHAILYGTLLQQLID